MEGFIRVLDRLYRGKLVQVLAKVQRASPVKQFEMLKLKRYYPVSSQLQVSSVHFLSNTVALVIAQLTAEIFIDFKLRPHKLRIIFWDATWASLKVSPVESQKYAIMRSQRRTVVI